MMRDAYELCSVFPNLGKAYLVELGRSWVFDVFPCTTHHHIPPSPCRLAHQKAPPPLWMIRMGTLQTSMGGLSAMHLGGLSVRRLTGRYGQTRRRMRSCSSSQRNRAI